MKRKRLGQLGERKAVRHVTRAGLRIIARNWTCPQGELDILAREGDVLVIIEVRTTAMTTSRPFAGGPEHTVGPEKQKRILALTRRWLNDNPWHPQQIRFDVVAVVRHAWWKWDVRWYRNAFHSQWA
jgi:putative endonuclease